MLSGIGTVKAFAQERREQRRFDDVAGYLLDSRRAVDRSAATFFPFSGYAFSLGGLIVWLAGGKSVIGGHITLGSLIAFLGYLGMFYGPISALTMLPNWPTGFLTAGQGIFEVLDADVTLLEPQEPATGSRYSGQKRIPRRDLRLPPIRPRASQCLSVH